MYRIKKILCPTDFSTFSKNALQYAARIAERHRSEITLMHVDEFDMSPLGHFHLHDDHIKQYHDLKIRFLKEQMDLFVRESIPETLAVNKQIVPGRSYKVIVEEAEQQEYDLIVLARRGVTNLSDHLIGSTAERVVRLARCPVLSIKGAAPEAHFDIKNILCPTDFSQSANSALTYAFPLAEQYGAKIYIQHISELPKEPNIEGLKKKIPDYGSIYADAGKIETETIFDLDIEPNNSIIRFAEDREVDLIVMSTHGRKGLRRVFIGNNTAEVVRKAECPVLTVTNPIHKVVFSRLATRGTENPAMTSS